MTDPTARDLIQRLADNLEYGARSMSSFRLLDEARAYLAASDEPAAPDGRESASVAYEPSDAELLELMPETMRNEFAAVSDVYSTTTGGQVKPGLFRIVLNTVALEYARAVLARYGNRTPAPIPLSERQPTEADYTTDGEAWYWDSICGCWFFLPGPPLNNHYTHWLPHWALPVPYEVEGGR